MPISVIINSHICTYYFICSLSVSLSSIRQVKPEHTDKTSFIIKESLCLVYMPVVVASDSFLHHIFQSWILCNFSIIISHVFHQCSHLIILPSLISKIDCSVWVNYLSLKMMFNRKEMRLELQHDHKIPFNNLCKILKLFVLNVSLPINICQSVS